MKFPYIAKITFDMHSHDPHYRQQTYQVINELEYIDTPALKAKHVHQKIDQALQPVLEDSVVKENLACKSGCTFCCYTEVGVTEDEAYLMAEEIQAGAYFNHLLMKQQIKHLGSGKKWLDLSYDKRRCPFLRPDNLCSIYQNRPSVCRTNMVLENPQKCDTRDGNNQKKLLVKTTVANMIIMGSFLTTNSSGLLPQVLGRILKKFNIWSKKKFTSHRVEKQLD